MRKTLAVLLAASCASSYAQDIYPEWPISGDDEFRTELLEPDFEFKRLEGEFDIAGHVMVWAFVINGLKLLLDKMKWP